MTEDNTVERASLFAGTHFEYALIAYENTLENILSERGGEFVEKHLSVFDFAMTAIELQFLEQGDLKVFRVSLLADNHRSAEKLLVVAATEIHAIIVAATSSESHMRNLLISGTLGNAVLMEYCIAREVPSLRDYANEHTESFFIGNEGDREAKLSVGELSSCVICDHKHEEYVYVCPSCRRDTETYEVVEERVGVGDK